MCTNTIRLCSLILIFLGESTVGGYISIVLCFCAVAPVGNSLLSANYPPPICHCDRILIAFRKAKIVYNFGLSECNKINVTDCAVSQHSDQVLHLFIFS